MSTPADVEIWESNGTSGVEVHTKATVLNFGSVDQPNLVALDHPLVIPVAGLVASFRKYTRWKLISWVDTTTINNLKWFKSAGVGPSNGWNERYSDGVYATPIRTNLPNQPWPTTAGTAIAITGTITNPTTGYVNATDYVIHNVYIDNTTTPGLKGAFTITYQYDES